MSNTAQQIADAFILSASAVNGNLIQANGSTAALATTNVLGVVQSAQPLASGALATVILSGRATVRLIAGLTPAVGNNLYLSSTAGLATTVANATPVGVVRSVVSTTVVIADLTLASANAIPTSALWPLATTRYYAVDYNNGNDSNIGYSDVSMAAAGTVAIKTLTQLRAIIPNNGAGRVIVIAINGNTDGITDLQYLKPDGITLDDLDLRGIIGYRQVLVRSTNGFSNSATDKKVCATAGGQAGPGTGGVWTCAAGATTNIFSVSSGTLNAELLGSGSDNGYRVRFTGNVTAALANQGFMLQRNTATQITLSRALTVAPAAGDTFVIETPGVSVDNIFVNTSVGSGGGLASVSVLPIVIVGIRARQTTLLAQFLTGADVSLVLCFVALDRCMSSRSMGLLNCSRNYLDETGTTITPGMGIRFSQASTITTIVNDITQSLNMQDSALLTMGANSFIIRALAITFGSGCYINTNGFVLFITSSNTNRSGLLGSNNSSALSRMVLNGRMTLTTTGMSINGIDLNNAGANPCITLSDTLSALNSYGIANLVSSSGGNTDVVLDATGVNLSTLNFSGTLTAAMATLGDVRTAGPVIVPFTTFATETYTDSQGNLYKPSTLVTITRRTPGIFYNVPILTVDPTTPLDGDVWITNIAGTRSLCCRIGGTTYRSTLT